MREGEMEGVPTKDESLLRFGSSVSLNREAVETLMFDSIQHSFSKGDSQHGEMASVLLK